MQITAHGLLHVSACSADHARQLAAQRPAGWPLDADSLRLLAEDGVAIEALGRLVPASHRALYDEMRAPAITALTITSRALMGPGVSQSAAWARAVFRYRMAIVPALVRCLPAD